jgi:hypothetical protein
MAFVSRWKGTLYATVDRADVKLYRELYTQAEVVEVVRKGKHIPSGAVIVLVQWCVKQDYVISIKVK